MIELYGNKIWNSNTPNKYKKVIIASEDSLDNICQELENSGLNYCAYIFNGEAHIAIGRATATNIDKLDIDYQTVIECNSKVYKTNNIIGTTTYDSIEDKLYRKYNTDFAYKIGQRLTEQGILFSGRIYGKTTTITVDKQYADTLNKISAELKEQRASFMSKSEVVQNESPEESKSVNEKISELHFNESQLSALAPSVKFIQTRNDDNLTDNFVSWFSDCTDFYESQLSALAEIYVDTYQSFSDKSLMFADTSRFNDLKQRFVNDNITAKLTENRGYSTTQLEIIREMVTYGMSESVINLLDYTFSIDEMQNFFTAYKNGSYEDLINLIADIKGTTRTDIEGQIEGGTYTPEIPDYDFLSKNLIFHNPSANHFTVMYFNPDSETGGQFVSTDINYNVAWRGNRDFTNDSERFWRYVEITGNQTLSDVGSKFFRESLNYFYSCEQIAEGLTTDTQKLIADVATAEMIKSGELIEPESFDVAKFDTLISEQKEITSNNSDKNTIVINAFAGPGAGKTTSCLEVAEKLKKQGFVTEYVQEYAKELVYDNNLIMLDGHYEHQFAILNEQMKRINRLYGKVDFIVTDSPILLNNTYLNEDKNTEVYSAYSDSVNKLYGLYNNFNYFVERDTSVFEKEGRIHNLEQSIAIDNELKNMLHNNQIDFDVYTHATIDNIVRDSTIIYAKQLINSYCQDEFDSEADFSDLKKVGVAYTTTEDSKHTVEAVVNLVDYRLETYVDDKLFKEETYADLKDMIDNCLHSLSFDDLVYLSDEELAPFYEEHDELDDVDPAVIRQQLEDAGIVNGELVDEDKLNSDPFIQQVMADVEAVADNSDLIGQKLTLDEHKFIVESVGGNGDVSMRDITFENTNGFPIFRSEKVAFVRRAIEEQQTQQEEITPAWERQPRAKAQTFDLHPDIPMADRHTFDLKAFELEEVGKKARFRRNVEAIRVLKECEFDNRFATPEEQQVLAQYVGWGGIPEAFDENNTAWADEFTELYGLLSPEEYQSARESTLTAFYTPPVVISAIYKAMEQMGFKEGNILEPSCGIGNFIGMLPQSMENSRVYGVEIDKISAGIAQQLYQRSSIAGQPFEEANIPDSFFDAVVGNVPFGDFSVADKRYDKNHFLIHDYFFAKSLDKLRPGGVMALVTSKGTMDKENPAVRKYIAQRAELLGAIRLPNNTFKGNAGTEVVSDILILQKRDRIIDIEPDWVHLNTDENGIRMNSYFVEHPDMVLGDMKMVSGRFGEEATCVPYENADLAALLDEAVSNIHGEINEYEQDEELEEEDYSIPADPNVRNFSYTLLDDVIYFRENSRMSPVDMSATAENRIKGLIEIRNSVRHLLELQTEDYPDSDIKAEMQRLNTLYDEYTKKYGLISSRANNMAFSRDSSYSLLSSLEVLDEDGNLERKADIFFKRTVKAHKPVTSVDTATEALAVSMGEKAEVDMDYMCELTGKSEQKIYDELQGVIFLNPLYENNRYSEQKYLTADEYLSGNVREKLETAQKSAAVNPDTYSINVQALERVQPEPLTASEISVRLGATWIPPEIIQQFVFEFLGTPRYAQWKMQLHYSPYTSEWSIENKSYDNTNIKAYRTYGTDRINAYRIIEETLNLKDVRIFDYVEDEFGKRKPVINKKETTIALQKQELIKEGFREWIWKDPQRRERLCKIYNEKFNSTRPREYDGSHITFSGMNPEIELREHQKNAVAHILYGGNTLLAHAVGAGKTFEMTAAAMESKRLGLCSKSLFVVPNHLTEQWAAEFLQLYPAANILVATKKDFETANRKRFCGRIATGDYDAIIIGHSQFEKIPMSIERQRALLEQQIDEITDGIAELKENRGDNFSIKQLEKTRKSIKVKLQKLNDQTRKDDVVTFEELGVDRLFIDESHYYKNLYLYTKMRNVGGIAQTEAQKSFDLFMKCRYLDEITGGRGTVFATGTPISNSMVELYTIQRYLQYETLVENGLQHFDAWASTFGETVTAYELKPEGYTLIGR